MKTIKVVGTVKKMRSILSAISYGKPTELSKHLSVGCSRPVLISQMSRLKRRGLSALLKDIAYLYIRGLHRGSLYPDTDIVPT